MDRFHLLLAAEQHHPEAAAMHGLFVLTYYAQHPSLSKPWLRAAQRESLREIFGEGKDWREVLSWPEDRARRQEAVALAKDRFARAPETPAIGRPVEGEMTVADLGTPGSPGYPSEYPARVEAWARSVAEHRVLADGQGNFREHLYAGPWAGHEHLTAKPAPPLPPVPPPTVAEKRTFTASSVHTV